MLLISDIGFFVYNSCVAYYFFGLLQTCVKARFALSLNGLLYTKCRAFGLYVFAFDLLVLDLAVF